MEDPQFSSEEEEGSISQENEDSNLPSGIDSEEDVIIVHKDVKKTHCLTTTTSSSDHTEVFGRQADMDSYQDDNLLTVNDSKEEEEEEDARDIMEDVEKQDLKEIEEDRTENISPQPVPIVTEGLQSEATDCPMGIQNIQGSEEETDYGDHTDEDNNHEGKFSPESTSDEAESLKDEGDFSTESLETTVAEEGPPCDIDARVQMTNDMEEEKEAAESEPEIIQRPDTASVAVSNEQSQILIKCSQGFGFFVDR